MYGRGFLIKLLKESLAGLPMWSNEKIKFPFYKPEHKFQLFTGEPIINIITGANGRRGTVVTGRTKDILPYWGTTQDVWQNMTSAF
jgi:hypothetical protein